MNEISFSGEKNKIKNIKKMEDKVNEKCHKNIINIVNEY